MSLRPCPACRRHVATTATSCVFCALALQLWPADRHRSASHGSWWRDVEVTAQQVTSLVLALPPESPPPDTSHMAKPYGAPPARRRVV